jgi:hypothetical protein
MKVLLVLVALAVLAVVGWLWLGKGLADPGYALQVVYDQPADGKIPMEIVLTAAMATGAPEGGAPNSEWQEWADRRIEVLDGSGHKVATRYSPDSRLVGASRGTPDVGFLRVTLTPGETYFICYRSGGKEPVRYHRQFVAPADAKSVSTHVLEREKE